MEFLRFLESIRTGIGDFFFATVTHIGEEVFFLAIAILFYWCISKRQGYYILITGVVGSVINQWLKILCRIPRPWILDSNFKPVGDAVAEATGYSFPSGHTQNVAGTFGCIGRYNKQRWVKIVSVTLILLVAFSRMYLGVHTPLDVTVSLGIAAALVFAFHFVFRTEESTNKYMLWVMIGSVAFSIAFIIYTFLLPESGFTSEADLANLLSAKKNAATLTGCLFGLGLVYPLDRYVIKFDTKGRWYSQTIKFVVGIAVVLLIKEGMRAPLEAIFGNVYLARAIRYFLIVAFAGGLWPLTFKFFEKLRIEKLERFSKWVVSKFRRTEATAE
jgi:undecaprenyl-diphosphatase